MKFYYKGGDKVGVVLTKAELAAIFAGHAETAYNGVKARLEKSEKTIGTHMWDREKDMIIHNQIMEFLEENK